MNLTTVEGPYMYNAVIDFTDVNPPLPINPVINEEKTKQYHVPIRINDRQQPFVHRSIVDCDNMIQINKWTKDFIYDIILPKLNEHEHFKYYHTQPLSFIKDNIIIGSTLIKDSVGFSQAIHTDPHHTVLAGVVHLQDAIDCGTTFYAHNPNTGEWTQKHQSPSKKFSGSVWGNMPNSWHGVPVTTSERLIYLINCIWKLNY